MHQNSGKSDLVFTRSYVIHPQMDICLKLSQNAEVASETLKHILTDSRSHVLPTKCTDYMSISRVERAFLSVCSSGAFRGVLMQSLGGKTPAIILGKQWLLPVKLRGVIRLFPCNLEWENIQEHCSLPRRGHQSKVILNVRPSNDQRECKKKKKTFVGMLKFMAVKWLAWKVLGRLQLRFAKLRPNNPSEHSETKAFGQKSACQHKRPMPVVKHGGGGVMIWARSDLPCIPRYSMGQTARPFV